MSTHREPIAVVGIGCRFANSAGPRQFWDNLVRGMDAITDVPEDRFDVDAFYDPRPSIPGRVATRWGSFVDDVHAFDAAYFRMSPREAQRLDPQQRVLLEAAADALADACLPREALKELNAGVYVGSCYSDWETDQLSDRNRIDLYTCTGSTRCTLSGRVSFVFDLQGPSVSVDAGCSSSLLTVHLACQSMWAGETSLALAGGVNLILDPGWTIGFSQAGMLSPDGRCKTFDARANGFVRADGCGVVALMPLREARARNLDVYALIRGSGASNDGSTNGLFATPSEAGQQKALRMAYETAGLSPHEVQYIECHGTGTPAGDPVEVGAIASVMRGRKDPCRIGSVKTNIGHTEGAAGVAGFIKTVLAVRHRQIPASLHFDQPSPKIPWDPSVAVAASLEPWPEGTARAGVSSFGISGTNVHVVLEECPPAQGGPKDGLEDGAGLLCLSSTSRQGLQDAARSYVDYLRDPSCVGFPAVCRTAALGRDHRMHRLTVAASDRMQAAAKLDGVLAGDEVAGVCIDRALEHAQGPVFVFSGQGSQWAGMGRRLLREEPVFARTLQQCDRAVSELCGWSVIDVLCGDDTAQALTRIDVLQPVLFAMQVGLAALWRSWGVTPSVVVGHSLGEIAAAHCVGILSLEQAVRIVCRRSQLLRGLSGTGGMLATELTLAEAEEVVARYPHRVGVAVSNSPSSTVLSGDPECLKELQAELEGREVFCRSIAADVAGHSPHLDPLLDDLRESLEGLIPAAGEGIPVCSTVTAEIQSWERFDVDYWVANLRQPVRFSDALQRLAERGHTTFLEVSPHPVLLGPIRQALEGRGVSGQGLPSLRRDEDEKQALLASLGALHACGQLSSLAKAFEVPRPWVKLPSYAWQREAFDEERAVKRDAPRGRSAAGGDEALLGEGVESAIDAGTHFFHSRVSLKRQPYIADHCVRAVPLLPGAGYVEMGLTAGTALLGHGPLSLRDVRFDRAMPLSADGADAELQLVASRQGQGLDLAFFGGQGEQGLKPLSTMQVSLAVRTDPATVDLEGLRARLESVDPEEHYRAAAEHGVDYGPAFRGIEQLWLGEHEGLSRLVLPPGARLLPSQPVHNALLDACWQTFAAIVFRQGGDVGDELDAYLPVGVEEVIWRRPVTTEAFAHASWRNHAGGESSARPCADIVLCDSEGQVLLEARGFTVQRLQAEGDTLDRWLYHLAWSPRPRPDGSRDLTGETVLVLADPGKRTTTGLVRRLEQAGAACVVAEPGSAYAELAPGRVCLDPGNPEHFERLVALASRDTARSLSVLHFWSTYTPDFEATSADALARDLRLGSVSLSYLTRALPSDAARVFLFTQGAQGVHPGEPGNPAQAPIWAFARVLRYERTGLSVRCIDLDLTNGRFEALSDSAVEGTVDELFSEVTMREGEDEIALRAGERFVCGLAHGVAETALRPLVQRAAVPTLSDDATIRAELEPSEDLPLARLRLASRPVPLEGEVLIEVVASGLGAFELGRARPEPSSSARAEGLGIECAGTIAAVGGGVRDLRPGQEVVAILGSRGAAARHVRVAAELVAPKPRSLSFEEAAALPLAYLTAHVALTHIGRLTRGETVFVHGCSGGTELALVQLSRSLGARVFASADSEEDRMRLRAAGAERAFDCHSLTLADEVRLAAGGEGVDVVVSAVAGQPLGRALAMLRDYGRFVDVSARNAEEQARLDLRSGAKGLTVAFVDAEHLVQQRPSLAGPILRELVARVEAGELRPPTLVRYPVSRTTDALGYLAQGPEACKVVLEMADADALVEIYPPRSRELTLSARAYLITGGLGGLGLSTARYLADHGARHLVLVGRSAPSAAAERAIAELTARGVEVRVERCDVADRADVKRLIAVVAEGGVPLAGIIHAAGVLDDGLANSLTEERFAKVAAPKVLGAENLHLETLHLPLSMFVLYSSAAATLGSPGQGNYAAANEFMDALARYRRATGRTALSINWGPWGESGLAVRADRAERLGHRGLGAMTDAQGLSLFRRLVLGDATNAAVLPSADWRQWAEYYPVARKLTMFEGLLRSDDPQSGATGGSVLERLRGSSAGERAPLVEAYLTEQIGRVLKLPADRKIDADLPLNQLGIDSLMALELKNRIEAEFGVAVPVSRILLGPSTRGLAQQLLEGVAQEDLPASGSAATQGSADGLLERVDGMSDEEVDALLSSLTRPTKGAGS